MYAEACEVTEAACAACAAAAAAATGFSAGLGFAAAAATGTAAITELRSLKMKQVLLFCRISVYTYIYCIFTAFVSVSYEIFISKIQGDIIKG